MNNPNYIENSEQRMNKSPMGGFRGLPPLGGRGAFRLKVITKKMLADLQTPVGIYLKIRDLYTNSVLLESSDYHGGENSFSYIGFKPIGGISVNNFLITEQYPDGSHIKTRVTDKMTVADRFDTFLKSFEIDDPQNQSIINGLLGYFLRIGTVF